MKHIRTKIMVAMASVALAAPFAVGQVSGGIQAGNNTGDAAAATSRADQVMARHHAAAGPLVAMGRSGGGETPRQAKVDAGLGVKGELRGQEIPAETGNSFASRSSTQQMAMEILTAEFDSREHTLQTVESKVVETRAAVAEISSGVQALQSDLRNQVLASIAKVNEAQDDLWQTIEEARQGRQEEWARLRAKLAAYYEVFAEAAAEANATAEAARSAAAPVLPPGLS